MLYSTRLLLRSRGRFPIYFPLRTPVIIRTGQQLKSHWWRCNNEKKADIYSLSIQTITNIKTIKHQQLEANNKQLSNQHLQ